MIINNLQKIVSTLYPDPDVSYKMFHLRNNGSLPHTFDIKLHTKDDKMTKDVPHTNTRHHCPRKKSKHDAKNGTKCGCEKITI